MMSEQFLTSKKFSMMIEKYARKNHLTYIDAICEICDQQGIDEKSVPKLILPSIKDKLYAEAVSFNYIKGGNTLPI